MAQWNQLVRAAKDALDVGDHAAVHAIAGRVRAVALVEEAADERAAIWFAAERLAMQASDAVGDVAGRQRALQALDQVSRSSSGGDFTLPGLYRQWALAQKCRHETDEPKASAACMAVLRRGEELARDLVLTGNWDSAVDSQSAELLLDVATYMMETGLALGLNTNFSTRRAAVCSLASFPAMLDLAALYADIDRRCVIGLEETLARRDLERAFQDSDPPPSTVD